MSRSQPLKSFDPFAINRFTNSSGVVPPPPMPSQYPGMGVPPNSSFQHGSKSNSSSPTATPSSSQPPSPLYAPQPTRPYMTSPPSNVKPIFESFRQDNASPELVLKKRPHNTFPIRSS